MSEETANEIDMLVEKFIEEGLTTGIIERDSLFR